MNQASQKHSPSKRLECYISPNQRASWSDQTECKQNKINRIDDENVCLPILWQRVMLLGMSTQVGCFSLPTNQRSVMSVLANQRRVLFTMTNQRPVLSASANQRPLSPGQQTPVSKVAHDGGHQAAQHQHRHMHPETVIRIIIIIIIITDIIHETGSIMRRMTCKKSCPSDLKN